MTTTQATNIVDYKNGAATIDADGHVNETGHLGEYIDPAHRGILELPPGTVRALTQPPADFRILATWDPTVLAHLATPGGSDGAARLRDMDREGIDAAVLYPTLLLEWREDPAGFGALCRAYNDWLRDYCAADTNRLFGVGAVPLQDIPAAIA
jgi:predicted TIM-barrel fold metal-dependent hydrolase